MHLLCLLLTMRAYAADPFLPAELVVSDTVLRPAEKVPPLGANGWGGCGAVEWAANNFVRNAGNEPVYWRNLHRAVTVGPNWFEIDGGGTSWYDLWASGFLSGASLRIYRLVDEDGKPLPLNEGGSYLDISRADHVQFVGRAQVIPEASPGFPDGGWLATTYGDAFPNASIRGGNLTCTDASGLANGRTYWYSVVAVSADNQESDLASEVSATPAAEPDTPPHVLIARDGDQMPELQAGQGFDFTPKVAGGRAPYRWEVVGGEGNALALPEGLQVDRSTGRVSGTAQAAAPDFRLWLKVTDADGRSDRRAYVLNPSAPTGEAAAKGRPEPPQDLRAVAGGGCVTLTWQPSPSANAVAYRLKRSTVPAAKQGSRVYLAEGAPALQRFDYLVVERRFDPFEMRWVHPRVRGIGNPADSPAWYWNYDASKTALALVAHPPPLPAEMADPGETCLQLTAGEGEQSISQFVFIGTERGGESIWYGQLEPGRTYRLEVWLRQEGLADDGRVTFSYRRDAYPGIERTFNVTGQWARYTYEFTGPERPRETWHFGHQFAFTGPGTLWMDNCRVFRCDRPEDADRPYVPNQTVLDELMASQPATGPKGAHRIWFLARDATMASLTSWHANSQIRPDWRTALEGTMEMTLPMGLMFDLQTGSDPATRMRPWLVLQHILHSEDDWLGLIEYLAAPYDPAKDKPEAKPWAYKRFVQRGNGRPWTNEFAEITIEFGNETWHNGVFEDWLGFHLRNWVHQGGPEYGYFARYLIETMKQSPYWASQGLDRKIRFSLGANHDGRVDPDGVVRGYGEEAMQTCPEASYLGHANYVGPKWETGDASSGVFDDHGVQETLLGFLTGPEPNQRKMMQAREALAQSHHEYDLAAYEGGPSGYALPGRDSPEQKDVNERYGKSLGMAVAALDAWMQSYAYGWTYQCFLGYGQGQYWNSHTWFSNGFRACPGWLALAMRNRYASGDLLAVEGRSTPTFQRGEETYPLVSGYAMRAGDRWSIFVVSRKLDGRHDGLDFGDGATPVALRLPFTRASRITLHKLTGDPRLSNQEAMNIAIESEDLPADALSDGTLVVNDRTGALPGGLPPGSIFLYVLEGAQ